MKKITIKVNGMHGTGCENRIKNAVKTISGVDEVEANHENGVVKVKAEDNVNKEEVKEKINSIGFDVKGEIN